MDEFSLENRVLICGKTKAGKSRLLKYLLLTEIKKKTFSKIILFCPTERINNFYSDIIDNNFIFDEFNEEYLKDLVQKLTQLNSNKKPKEMKKVLLILDDIVCDTDIHHSKVIKLFILVVVILVYQLYALHNLLIWFHLSLELTAILCYVVL